MFTAVIYVSKFITVLKVHKDFMNRDSVVCTVTRLLADITGIVVHILAGPRYFSSPSRPDRLWSLPGIAFKVYPGILSQGKVAGA